MQESGESHCIRRLIVLFLGWKLVLIILAYASPGPGYDTSTQILFDQYGRRSNSWVAHTLEHLALRLTRWDGIYFATLAERGHVNEQDWAFSWVLARVNDSVTRVLFSTFSISPIIKCALCGIVMSHISHLLAVISLYRLTVQLIPSSARWGSQIAFTAATLHILSPAGLFLSAPYGESTFAYLSFTGMLSYARAVQRRYSPGRRSEAFYTVLSGVFLALAASIRGNGLFNGILFAWDLLEALLQPNQFQSIADLGRVVAIGAAGMLVGIGFAIPQVIAYMEFCTGGQTREWCEKIPPSIYSWVQDHYWEVGFLRYWTLSNVPLFLIAGPVLGILLLTGTICVWKPKYIVQSLMAAESSKGHGHTSATDMQQKALTTILQRLALPQVTLAVMTATSFHIQIINRISSGYPLWYIVLAIVIHFQRKTDSVTSNNAMERPLSSETESTGSFNASVLRGRRLQSVVRGMALYAIVQGGLYASFLPPA